MNFSTYLKKLKNIDAARLSSSLYELLSSVSKFDSKRLKPFASSAATQYIIRELASFFSNSGIELPKENMTPEQQLDYISYKLGIYRRRIELRGEWWRETTAPLLCVVKETDAYCLLMPLPGGGYRFSDPNSMKMVKVTGKTAEFLSPEAYCFYRTFPNKELKFFDLSRFIAKFLTFREIAIVVFVTVLVLGVNLFVPVLNRILFDTVIPSGTEKDIRAVAGLLLGVAVASVSFGLMKSLYFKRISNKAKVFLQGAAWGRVLSLPTKFFKQYSSNEIYQKVEDVNEIGTILFGSAINTVLSVLLSSVYIFQISGIAPSLAMPTVSISVLTLLVSVLLSILSVRYQKRQISLKSELHRFTYEIIMGIAKIKVAGAQARAFAKWVGKYSGLTKVTYSPNVLIIMSDALYTLLSLGTVIFIYFTAAANNVAPADFVAFNVAFASFAYMLMQFHKLVAEIANLTSLYDSADPILKNTAESTPDLRKVEKLTGNIELNNISFRYAEDSPMVLDGISLSIKAGEYVAIVGTSGCGKSTLLRILLGFEKPCSGTLHYDDQDINGLDVVSIRRQIGAVMQNGTLFADDIYSNITICNPSLTVEEAFDVAKMAGLEEDINEMPMGMFTMISEGAGEISGGQKQRLMIARVFASNPSIIMFDEATSALDNLSQQKIIRALEEFKATKIVIAHRLSTIVKCDRIIVLDKGKIAETGSYDSLIEQKGLFYKMAQRQIV